MSVQSTVHQGAAMPMTTTSYATSSIADLLPRISGGDPAAWAEVVDRYGTFVSAIVRSCDLPEADALDAVQMTWLRLAENAHRVQFPERLGGWLATTARRECLSILRQRAKLTLEPGEVIAERVADPSPGPEQRVIRADTARILWKLVGELPPRRRDLLKALFTDSPRPYSEIARDAGLSAGWIGPTRARALQDLRGKAEKHALNPDH